MESVRNWVKNNRHTVSRYEFFTRLRTDFYCIKIPIMSLRHNDFIEAVLLDIVQADWYSIVNEFYFTHQKDAWEFNLMYRVAIAGL